MDDFHAAGGAGMDYFLRVRSDVHHRLSDIVHRVAVHRRDEAIRSGGTGCVKTALYTPKSGFGLTWCPLLHSSSVPGGSGVLADPARIDEEFRKAWLPYFCRSGHRDASFEEFALEVDEWLPVLLLVSLPELASEMLAEVARRESATGSLDGWSWRELKVLPVPLGFMALRVFFQGSGKWGLA